MSPFDVPESDNITLVTSDEPPQRHVVSRSRLTVLSGVFRDLLSTPTTAEDEQKQEIPLTEKSGPLFGLIRVVQGEEDKLSVMKESEWSCMARMADKYNCTAATREVVLHAWQLIAQGKVEDAFYLATVLNNEVLVKQLCSEAVDKRWHVDTRCDPMWTGWLIACHSRRQAVVRDNLLLRGTSILAVSCEVCNLEEIYMAQAAAAFHVMRSYKVSMSVASQLRSQLEKPTNPITLCKRHIAAFCNSYAALDSMIGSQLDISKPHRAQLTSEV